MSAGSPDPIPAPTPDDLTAGDLMSPVTRTCSPFSTVTEAVLFFKEQDVDVVPVVDAGKPLGVVVDRDVALAVADTPNLEARPVSEIMVTDFPTVPADAHVDQVLQTMTAANSRLALVVDAEGLLVGLLFWSELARVLPEAQAQAEAQAAAGGAGADDATAEVTNP